MVNDNNLDIKTDPILQRLVQPSDKKALASLREDLIHDASTRTLMTWKGYLLLDYEKYDICKSLKIPFLVDDKSFFSYEHAASYICSDQLKRTDLTNEYRKYLIGELFLFEEQIMLNSNRDRINAKYRIAYKIGEKINLSGGTVLKYSVYAQAMNTIFEQSATFALRILLSQTKVSHENVIELSRLAPDELKTISRSAVEENTVHLTFSDIRHEVKYTHTQTKAPVSRRERKEQKEKSNAGIRKMPEYNPDSDVNSLCMTINSWVSSIERVNSRTDFSTISNRAMLELMKQLTILESTINTLQKSLVERTVK